MTAPFELGCHLPGLAITTARTQTKLMGGATRNGQKDHILHARILQQLIHDQIMVADGQIHVANPWRQLPGMTTSPLQPHGIFDLTLDADHFQQRVIQQAFQLPIEQFHQRMEVVGLHQFGVITGAFEIWVRFNEQVGHLGQMYQGVELFISQTMLLNKLIGQTGRTLLHIKMITGVPGLMGAGMMIDHHPTGAIQSRFHAQIAHPGGMLHHLPILPGRQVVGGKRDGSAKLVLCQTLEKTPRHKAIQIAFVSQNDLWFLQCLHGQGKLTLPQKRAKAF